MAVGQPVQLAEHRVAVPLVEGARLEIVGVEPRHAAAAAACLRLGGIEQSRAEPTAPVPGRQPKHVDEQHTATGLGQKAA